MKLGEKMSTSPRYWIDITGTDLLSLGELGGVNSKKQKKLGIFDLRKSDRILMKFQIQKDLETQISYFKSRPDPVSLGGGVVPEILEKRLKRGDQDET